MEKVDMTVEDYLDSLEAKHRPVMETLIEKVKEANPAIEPSVWQGVFWGGSQQSILGYGEMDYQTSKGEAGSWFKVGLSRQKNYYSLYVTAVKDGQYVLKSYKDKLGKVKTGASSISFTRLENVDLDQLQALLNESLNDEV